MTDGGNPVADAWSAESVISILNLVRDGVLVVDPSDVIRYANPIAAERLGRRPADVVGQPLFELLAGLEGSSVPARLAELRRTGGEVAIEEYVPVLHGWFHMVANAIGGDITILVREMTGQLRAERHRELATRLDDAVASTATTGRGVGRLDGPGDETGGRGAGQVRGIRNGRRRSRTAKRGRDCLPRSSPTRSSSTTPSPVVGTPKRSTSCSVIRSVPRGSTTSGGSSTCTPTNVRRCWPSESGCSGPMPSCG